ncbi:hypothetical protein COE43_12695 [Bacillus cereus]|nr:hypothetical protein COE43_12695 [Bacillus cereus]
MTNSQGAVQTIDTHDKEKERMETPPTNSNGENELTPEEKIQLNIEKLQQKLKMEKQKQRALERKKKDQERRERNHRLIQVGAIFESHFDIIGPQEAEQIAIQFAGFIKEKKRIDPNYVLLKDRKDENNNQS